MKTPMTTSPWLGERGPHPHGSEVFPETTLNDAQVRSLLNTSEGGRRVQNLSATARPSIMAITDEITEIHVEFGRKWPDTAHLVFWYDKSGNVLAAVEEKYEGPQGVHPPGAKFRKWAVGYLRTPEMSRYDDAEKVEYERMYCISDKGAIDQVRKYIRETWISTDE